MSISKLFFSTAMALCLLIPAASLSTVNAQERRTGTKDETKSGQTRRDRANAPVCFHPPGKASNDHSGDTLVTRGKGHQDGPNYHSLPCSDQGGPNAVPEPVTVLLFGAGLAGVGYVVRRRKNAAERDEPTE